jgi:hypothetical protein
MTSIGSGWEGLQETDWKKKEIFLSYGRKTGKNSSRKDPDSTSPF